MTSAPTVVPTINSESIASVRLTFIAELAVKTGTLTRKKIEEVGVANVHKTIVHSNYDVSSKHIMNNAYRAISFLSEEISKAIADQFTSSQLDLHRGTVTYNDIGSLGYKEGQSMYLHNEAGYTTLAEGSLQSYKLLILETLNKGKNVLLGNEGHSKTYVAFSSHAKEGYSADELYNQFVYFDNKWDLLNPLSSKAIAIFNKDVDTAKTFVKQAFEKYKQECAVLKETPNDLSLVVCSGSMKNIDSPEELGKIALCLHTFEFAKELCGKASPEDAEPVL
jgi:hypothetical protein